MPHLSATETRNYRPLDRRNDYPWEILKERLVRELGNEFATFLAEPVTRANEGVVDWYVASSEPAIRVAELIPEDRQQLLERLHAMRMQIYALADKIDAPNRRDRDKRFADAIRRATIVPSTERFVWSLHGQPTLVLWGMLGIDDERDLAELMKEALVAPHPRTAIKMTEDVPPPSPAPPPSPPHAPNGRRRFPFVLPLALLFAVLLGAIYYEAPRRDASPKLPPKLEPAPAPQSVARDTCNAGRDAARNQDTRLEISLAFESYKASARELYIGITCPTEVINFGFKNDLSRLEAMQVAPSNFAAWTNPMDGHYKISVARFYGDVPRRDILIVIYVKCGNNPAKALSAMIHRMENAIHDLVELDYPSCTVTQNPTGPG